MEFKNFKFKTKVSLESQKDKIDICKNCNVWDEGGELISNEFAEKVSLKNVNL